MSTITVIGPDSVAVVDGVVEDGAARIATSALAESVGWALRPEGLCRGESCLPVADAITIDDEGNVDLASVAAALRAPFAWEPSLGVGAVGAAAALVDAWVETATAPDFTLPSFDRSAFTLSSIGRKKKLLVAWASW